MIIVARADAAATAVRNKAREGTGRFIGRPPRPRFDFTCPV
jgi:hypothetical protein